MKLINQVLICLIICSCSTKWRDYFYEQDRNERNDRNEKLMESFEVKKDVLQKFKVEKKKSDPVKPSEQKAPITISSKQGNSRKAELPKPNILKKLSSPKTKSPKVRNKIQNKGNKNKVKKNKTNIAITFKYPNDYPEKLQTIDNKTKNFWSNFRPKIFPGEKTYFDINYMGVSTGNIILSTNDTSVIDGKNTYFFNARAKTSSYYSYLYELDDNIDSYVEEDNFRPIKFSLIQRESGQNIDDLQLFDNDKMKTYFFYKRVSKNKTKKKQGEKYTLSHYVDPLSVIWFLRGHPKNEKSLYEIPIINKGKVIILKTKMLGVEKIKTKIGEKHAIKILGTTKYSGDTLKSGDMTFWFSDDDKRVFLKFNAKIKIGSISGEIDKYEF